MSTAAFLGSCLALGLGGFDPAPLLIAAVFMASRPDADAHAAREARRGTLVFGLVLIGGTALWGTVLSRLFGSALAEVPWGAILRGGAWAAGAEALLGAAALVWAVLRWRARNRPAQPEKDHSLRGLVLVALGFVAIVTSDVPFVVAVGLSGHQPLWAVVLGQVLWAVVSQAPLFLLCLAVLAHRHRAMARVVGGWWEAIRPGVRLAVPVLLAVLGLLLLLDAADFLVTGQFLVHLPSTS